MTEDTKYEEFIEKFKHKKTTDDCYTPPKIYEVVKDWAVKEYKIDESKIVRPFYPGGDYKNFDYSGDKVVVDNPPFSILTKIIDFYLEHNIMFFLFANGLTLISLLNKQKICAICVGERIKYENGAKINTGFITNLDTKNILRTAPELKEALKIANGKKQRASWNGVLYKYPYCVINGAGSFEKYAKTDVAIKHSEAMYCNGLDEQKRENKKIFGDGLLISRKKAKELELLDKTKTIKEWNLSDREVAIIDELGEK